MLDSCYYPPQARTQKAALTPSVYEYAEGVLVRRRRPRGSGSVKKQRDVERAVSGQEAR